MFTIEMKHIGKIEAVGTVQVFGYSARNRLTDVRDAVYRLLDGLPMHKRSDWHRARCSD